MLTLSPFFVTRSFVFAICSFTQFTAVGLTQAIEGWDIGTALHNKGGRVAHPPRNCDQFTPEFIRAACEIQGCRIPFTLFVKGAGGDSQI